MLVLHDPTSALDPVTAAQVAEGLRAARAGLTTVVVATSGVLLARCDRVVDLDAGREPALDPLTTGAPAGHVGAVA
ncbi:hypothetical protein GCM10025864_09920 [Luteimicrobium album]|uniref:ABC transporter ATP-binding protein n=1 Tax=Luteimicrobium album TaxID=1054550 RepID=A0ABQ6HXI8_9MICO|nr:hypothetical protein GCM10025864_09920 [Luteimicrobium album]